MNAEGAQEIGETVTVIRLSWSASVKAKARLLGEIPALASNLAICKVGVRGSQPLHPGVLGRVAD